MSNPQYANTTGTVWQSIQAAVDLPKNTVVMYSPSGVVPFVPTNSNYPLVAGITDQAVSQGLNAFCISHGNLISGGAFISNTYYFAGPDGTLITPAPSTGLVLQIGYAIDDNTILVNIQQPTVSKQVFAITVMGNGTTTYSNPDLLDSTIVLLQIDGVGKFPGKNYSYDNVETITFGSVVHTESTLIILYTK